MSFAVGGLFLNESVEVARLQERTGDWEETLTRAMETGIVTSPKLASQRRTLREIANRLSTLNDNELRFLAEADRSDQQALLWLATCRAYRFAKEFAVEVVQDRFLSYRCDLPLESFDTFFEEKAEWNEALAKIRPATRKKLRQVLFRIMRESGVLTENNIIQRAYLSARLKRLLQNNCPQEFRIFPGMMAEAD